MIDVRATFTRHTWQVLLQALARRVQGSDGVFQGAGEKHGPFLTAFGNWLRVPSATLTSLFCVFFISCHAPPSADLPDKEQELETLKVRSHGMTLHFLPLFCAAPSKTVSGGCCTQEEAYLLASHVTALQDAYDHLEGELLRAQESLAAALEAQDRQAGRRRRTSALPGGCLVEALAPVHNEAFGSNKLFAKLKYVWTLYREQSLCPLSSVCSIDSCMIHTHRAISHPCTAHITISCASFAVGPGTCRWLTGPECA